jgi:hypothetical protein
MTEIRLSTQVMWGLIRIPSIQLLCTKEDRPSQAVAINTDGTLNV